MSPNKEIASLFAQGALLGIALHHLQDDRGHAMFIATKDEMTARFSSIAEVRAWLDRLKAQQVADGHVACLEIKQTPVPTSAKPGTPSGLAVESDSTLQWEGA